MVPPRVEPLRAERYKVQFTVSADLREKLSRAADLMRHTNPSGDLAVIVEKALDLLVAKLEKQRLGKTSQERKRAPKSKRSGYVPRAVRREVFARDGERCTFVDAHGQRCEACTLLELDHIILCALGGTDDPSNLRVRCRISVSTSTDTRSSSTRSAVSASSPRTSAPAARRGAGETPSARG